MYIFTIVRTALLAISALSSHTTATLSSRDGTEKKHWVEIWATMPQLTEPANLPPPPFNQTNLVFQNTTLRQTIQITQSTASALRLRISNAFGLSDLPITGASIAVPLNKTAGSGTSAIDPSTLRPLTFSGSPGFIVPGGAQLVSEPVLDFVPLEAGDVVSVSLYLETGQMGNAITSHPGSRTTSWMVEGNQINSADVAVDSSAQSVDHWYFISALDAYLPSNNRAMAIIGDSITDGRGSTTNANNRWPDRLVSRLQANPATSSISVLNQAAGGNRILRDGLGPNALGRLDRDVLSHAGVRYAMIFEGVNDIGTANVDPSSQQTIGTQLLAAYEQMIVRLHAFGMPVFGATIAPFSGPGQPYGDPERERTRQRVNAWIRDSGRFDAVVDFDAVVRNETQLDRLRNEYDSGDYLHPNPAGYEAMAAAFDLALFDKFADGVEGMI